MGFARQSRPHGAGAAALGALLICAGAGAGARAADVTSPAPFSPPPAAVPSPPVASDPGAAPVGPAPGPPAAPAPSAPDAAERKLPTLDATPAESDHEAVRDAWGVEVRPVATRLPVFGLRASGCPAALAAPATGTTTASCAPVPVSALAARRWMGRNLAIDAGLALAVGGGSDGGHLLDTYFGLGPVFGASVLLANWRHVAVMAGPELTLVVFRGAGGADTAYLVELLGTVEAELHFGFIGAPALSLGLRSGLAFRLEHAADATLWSVGVGGATSVRGLFEDVALRYYF